MALARSSATRSSATLKILSVLLRYPTADLVMALPEIGAALDDIGPGGGCETLRPLLAELATRDLYDLQADYVDLFDKTRRRSLHLFEHIHGESRDRGQAMVDLVQHYAQHGLLLTTTELPDYVPLFLEFLSTRPLEEARETLGQTVPILAKLHAALAERASPYAGVLTVLLSLMGEGAAIMSPAATDGPPDGFPHPDAHLDDDLTALDAAWAETAVSFGPGDPADGCTASRLTVKMRAIGRDARYPA